MFLHSSSDHVICETYSLTLRKQHKLQFGVNSEITLKRLSDVAGFKRYQNHKANMVFLEISITNRTQKGPLSLFHLIFLECGDATKKGL